jgi:hypothetical protein
MAEICMKSLLAAALSIAIALAPNAHAQVGHASEGYVYFHRAGATAADHHAALAACLREAQDLRWISPDVANKKLADKLVANHFIVDGARRQLRANIENCMVVNGWAVVRLDPMEGARLSHLPQDGLKAELNSLIGVASVKGEVVRRFAPATDYFNGQFYLDKDASITSLSILADDEVSAAFARANTAGAIYAESRRTLTPSVLLPVASPEGLAPTATVIVVRAIAIARGGFDFVLARADGDPETPNGYTMLQAYAHAPKRMLDKYGPDQTFVYVVPPGRWRLISTSSLSFCLGAPAFDVAEGEAIFAGAFRGGPNSAFAPDMATAEVRTKLPTALANRLKPAAWRDDRATSCAAEPQPYSYFYRLEFPSALDLEGRR